MWQHKITATTEDRGYHKVSNFRVHVAGLSSVKTSVSMATVLYVRVKVSFVNEAATITRQIEPRIAA